MWAPHMVGAQQKCGQGLGSRVGLTQQRSGGPTLQGGFGAPLEHRGRSVHICPGGRWDPSCQRRVASHSHHTMGSRAQERPIGSRSHWSQPSGCRDAVLQAWCSGHPRWDRHTPGPAEMPRALVHGSRRANYQEAFLHLQQTGHWVCPVERWRPAFHGEVPSQ